MSVSGLRACSKQMGADECSYLPWVTETGFAWDAFVSSSADQYDVLKGNTVSQPAAHATSGSLESMR